jgi:hypothetical protein
MTTETKKTKYPWAHLFPEMDNEQEEEEEENPLIFDHLAAIGGDRKIKSLQKKLITLKAICEKEVSKERLTNLKLQKKLENRDIVVTVISQAVLSKCANLDKDKTKEKILDGVATYLRQRSKLIAYMKKNDICKSYAEELALPFQMQRDELTNLVETLKLD